MRKGIIVLTVFALAQICHAQDFKWGAKVGIGTGNLRSETIESPNNFRLTIKDAKFGYYAGLFGSVTRGRFLLQPEILFNSNRVDYSFRDFKSPATSDSIKTERYSKLDIPILLGAKVGPVLLKAGPVAHIHLASNSELTEFSGYKEKWNAAQWGYQVGVGLNFTSRMHLDIRYEGNFDKWGSQMTIKGSSYSFSQRPSRWLVNVGYAF